MFGTASAATLAQILPQLIGGKQVGPAAPAINGGLLGGGPPAVPQMDPVAESLKQSSLEDIDNGAEQVPFMQSFLGGLDKGLQSPSQMLGLGLLSRLSNQNPYVGLAGLAGMGLLNRNK